jgi:tetratricopeptide (TPR) repeat protein
MSKKEILIELREKTYQQLKDFMDGLSDSERTTEGQPDDWSIKDALVHVALWGARLGNNLQAIGAGEAPTDYGDYQTINDQEFKTHRKASWVQLLAMVDAAQEALMAGLAALDDEQLLRNDLLPGDQERPTWHRVAGSCVTHPMIHMGEYLTQQSQTQEALEMVTAISDELAALDDGDSWQGLLLYNKACYQALAGHKEKAIQMLGQSLKLYPWLVEWSQEDSDLDSLREEPDFQALYQ